MFKRLKDNSQRVISGSMVVGNAWYSRGALNPRNASDPVDAKQLVISVVFKAVNGIGHHPAAGPP
eukprot:5080390-Karenia_brevis.AAC.1